MEIAPLGPDGLPAGPVRWRARPRRGRARAARGRRAGSGGRPPRSTRACSPRGCGSSGATTSRTPRPLLLGHEGRLGEPRSAAAALARLRGGPVPPDPPQRSAEPGVAVLPLRAAAPSRSAARRTLLEVYAEQQRRHDATAHPDRMRLLTAAESAGMLVAAEMNRAGLPWRADVHRELLHELLGERYAGGGEPRRLAELADEVSAAFGQPGAARPARRCRQGVRAGRDQGEVDPALGARGDRPPGGEAAASSTRSCTASGSAHGWTWLQDWVRDGPLPPRVPRRAARSPAAGSPTAGARCRSPR